MRYTCASISQYDNSISPANPGLGPWTPSTGWQWTSDLSRNGATVGATDYAMTKWGGTISAFNADVCGRYNPVQGTGFLAGLTDPCASSWGPFELVPNYIVQTPPAGCCANARMQPDNSGGFQRCVLVAAGTNNAPVTSSTCVTARCPLR
jgi:hypothetical protein